MTASLSELARLKYLLNLWQFQITTHLSFNNLPSSIQTFTMARTRPRPEEPQPVPEAEAKKPSRHREQDTDRKQNNAPQDARRNIEVIFGSIAKRTPQKSGHKYSDRTIASVSGIFKSHARAKKSRRREKTPPLITALEGKSN